MHRRHCIPIIPIVGITSSPATPVLTTVLTASSFTIFGRVMVAGRIV